MSPHAAYDTHPQDRGQNPHQHRGKGMVSIKTELIQLRWKAVVKDLSEQSGIDSQALLQKMPAFAVGTSRGYCLDLENISRAERQVLRAAADIMAELILVMIASAARPHRLRPQEIGAHLIGKSASLRTNK